MSKHWHKVASSIPQLWSTIEIIIDDQKETSHSQLLTTTTTFLKRSGNLPLSVMLSFEPPRCHCVSRHTTRFIMTTLRLLLENFQRWRSVSFNFGNITFELPPLPQQVVAPFLEHIDIKFHSPSIPNPSYYAALVAASAPGLRSYVAHASNCNVPPNLPWGQLHKFHPTCPIRQPDAYTILSRAKNLQEFHFVIHRDPRGVIAPPPVRITSSIRSMSVIGHGTRPLDFLLLSRLDTPHLKALHIIFLMPVVPRDIGLAQQHAILFSFLSSGSFRLSSLTIGNLLMTESQLMDCLRLLSPSLTTLKILTNTESLNASDIHIFEVFTNTVLKSLTFFHDISTGSGLLCPALESLTLCRCVGADDGVLSDMIQSRHGSSPTAADRLSIANVAILRCLEVVFDANTHPTDLTRLSELYREGLRGGIWLRPHQAP